jgi:hypothetical protein
MRQVIEIYVSSEYERKVQQIDLLTDPLEAVQKFFKFLRDEVPTIYLTYEVKSSQTHIKYMFDTYNSCTNRDVDCLDVTYVGYTYGESVMDIDDTYFKDEGSYYDKIQRFFASPTFLSPMMAQPTNEEIYVGMNAVGIGKSLGISSSEYKSQTLYVIKSNVTQLHTGKNGMGLEWLLYNHYKYTIYTHDGNKKAYSTFTKKKVVKPLNEFIPIATVVTDEDAKEFAEYCCNNYNLKDDKARFNNWLINLFLNSKNSYHGKIKFLLPLCIDEGEKREHGNAGNSTQGCTDTKGNRINDILENVRSKQDGTAIKINRAKRFTLPNRRLFE